MKKPRAILSAIALASAAFASSGVYAADLGGTTTDLVIMDNTAFFGNVLTGGNMGGTFTDRYNFTTTMMGDLSADLLSMTGNARNGLDITGFSLFNSTGQLLGGTMLSTGATDSWSLNYNDLAAGSYYLQVQGSLVSNAAGKYYANIALAPVPEPETYAMMLAGLGMLGFAARRRKHKSDQA